NASNALSGTITLGPSGAGNATLVNTVATALAGTTIGGNLSVTSTGGAITQTGVLTVTGTSSFDAGANAITLNTFTNMMTGAVSFNTTGNNSARLTNGIATNLGASSVGRNLTISSVGAITNSGALTVGNNASFTTTAGN